MENIFQKLSNATTVQVEIGRTCRFIRLGSLDLNVPKTAKMTMDSVYQNNKKNISCLVQEVATFFCRCSFEIVCIFCDLLCFYSAVT